MPGTALLLGVSEYRLAVLQYLRDKSNLRNGHSQHYDNYLEVREGSGQMAAICCERNRLVARKRPRPLSELKMRKGSNCAPVSLDLAQALETPCTEHISV